MLNMLKKIFIFLNKDFTGKTWEREMRHPYFGQMIYYGSKDSSKCYWEAELSPPGLTKKIGITMMGTSNGPEPSEESFYRSVLADLDGLFEKCEGRLKKSIQPGQKSHSLPSGWTSLYWTVFQCHCMAILMLRGMFVIL